MLMNVMKLFMLKQHNIVMFVSNHSYPILNLVNFVFGYMLLLTRAKLTKNPGAMKHLGQLGLLKILKMIMKL
jgi:hypothetical protein